MKGTDRTRKAKEAILGAGTYGPAQESGNLKRGPPKCPRCDRPLEDVYESEETTWSFKRKDGWYSNGTTSETTYRCPECHGDITSTFPGGIREYHYY